jgi:hypothetical protein
MTFLQAGNYIKKFNNKDLNSETFPLSTKILTETKTMDINKLNEIQLELLTTFIIIVTIHLCHP